MSKPMGFDEIGEVLGVSGQRAKQICDRALLKLTRRHARKLAEMRDLANELGRHPHEEASSPFSFKQVKILSRGRVAHSEERVKGVRLKVVSP